MTRSTSTSSAKGEWATSTDTFDCIILTQTLQTIYDMKAALETLHRILKPGGVPLLTSAAMSKIARRLGTDDWGE